jgi:hypothetical protein
MRSRLTNRGTQRHTVPVRQPIDVIAEPLRNSQRDTFGKRFAGSPPSETLREHSLNRSAGRGGIESLAQNRESG